MLRVRFAAGWALVATGGLGLVGGCPSDGGGGNDNGNEVDVIAGTDPADGETGVATSAEIVVTFTSAAVESSLEGNIAPEVEFTLQWSADSVSVTVVPASALAAGTTYTVTVESVELQNGASLDAPFTFEFTTAAAPPTNGNDNGPDDEEPPVTTAGWQQAGFGGAGNFLGIYFDPVVAGVVYACSDVAGLLRSTDHGRTWEVRSAGLGNYEISSLVIDPFDHNTLFAGGGSFADSAHAGVYLSRDAGRTWNHLVSTANNGITYRRFRTNDAIAADPFDEGAFLFGTRSNGIWRTVNGGAGWEQVYEPGTTSADIPSIQGGSLVPDDPAPPFSTPVLSVVFDANTVGVVYAGLGGGGVIKSTQAGALGTWSTGNVGLPASAVIEGLAVGPDNVVYAAAGRDGIYKSTNGGDSWAAANGDVPLEDSEGIGWRTSVAVHPTDPDIAYQTLATYDTFAVWKTTDGGATWSQAADESITYDADNDPTRVWAANPAPAWQVKINPFDPDRLLATTFWAIVRSDDGGQTWSDSIAGAQNTCVTGVYVDTDHPAGEPDVLYATHMDAGLMRSTDGGARWTPVIPSSADEFDTLAGHCWRMAVARVGDTKYHYATCDPWPPVDQSLVLRSTDGVSWSVVFETPRAGGGFLNGMLGLAIVPNEPSTIYVTNDGGRVYKSTNNGDRWDATGAQPGATDFTYALTVDTAGRVFAGTLENGLWRSVNGGDSWDRVFPGHATIFHCAAGGGKVYAAAADDGNLYRSDDGGETWDRVTDFDVGDDGTDGDSVGDQGWFVAVDPGDADHIVFTRADSWHPADRGSGVVESFDGGDTWTELYDGLGLPKVNGIAFGSNGDLLAGTSCGGIWYFDRDSQ